jgi:positive regulator of sigma E activity
MITELVGYFAMGMSVLSFAFSKQKLVRMVNLFACMVWVWYGFLIQNNPTIIVNIMVCMVHMYWFIKRWNRINKLNRRQNGK